jgi:hypothetical protein
VPAQGAGEAFGERGLAVVGEGAADGERGSRGRGVEEGTVERLGRMVGQEVDEEHGRVARAAVLIEEVPADVQHARAGKAEVGEERGIGE